MAFTYNELYKRYEELKEKNKELSKSTTGDISKYKKTINRLKRQVNDDTRIIEKKNKQIKEYELIIDWLLERNG